MRLPQPLIHCISSNPSWESTSSSALISAAGLRVKRQCSPPGLLLDFLFCGSPQLHLYTEVVIPAVFTVTEGVAFYQVTIYDYQILEFLNNI